MTQSTIFSVPPVIHAGQGAAAQTGPEAARLGAKKALVVSDAFLASSGTIKPVLDSLIASGIDVTLYADVNSEPTLAHVQAGMDMVRASGCDLIVGCGGGSPLDVAKTLSIMAVNKGDIKDYMGFEKVPRRGLPVIAVPTTAGTGSEATRYTIITDTDSDVKMLITSAWLMPQAAIVDPLLTLTMPKGITAATGMDALTHAIEAYVSRKAQPMSDLYALNAVRLLYKNLPVAWARPDNVEARADTLLGALQAGIAFSNASVALVHGMSRPVGALFHVAHGVSNAALLGPVMEFSLTGNLKRYADIALAMGLPDAGSDEKNAQAAAENVQALTRYLEIPGLEKLGVTREKLDLVVGKMADDAIASGSPGNNPRLAEREEIIQLYYSAL